MEPALNQPAPLFMEMLNKSLDKLKTSLMKNHASAVEGHERIQLVQRSLKHLPWFNWLFAVGQYQGSL